ncbi:SET domain-containing protein 9-like [Antedon mediterranea]|uniref:SET domain-containing protein 9-like n=1 Tax=Antedon mediterranea TaxID=105859 RepID=UPI003AF48FE1
MLFRNVSSKWKSYRYRFSPWLKFNIRKRNARQVAGNLDKILEDEDIIGNIAEFFVALEKKGTEDVDSVMNRHFGFVVHRGPSKVVDGDMGVIVSKGYIPAGSVTSIYPGTIYQPYDPIFFQSINNSFIFRCLDGIHIDGNDKRLSKMIFRSCSQRDCVGPYMVSDMSWLTHELSNPLSIGQYVNNQTKKFPANVAYQEIDFTENFAFELRKYLPYICYSASSDIGQSSTNRLIRSVVLVSLRDIHEGEELLSSYFNIIS